VVSETYRWYRSACEAFNYPAGPYGSLIKALVTDNDTVLDLGCGIGAASLMVSPWCKQLVALDADEDALACLAVSVRERNITNIVTEHGAWPLAAPVRADIVIVLHVSRVPHSPENLKLIFESANKGGFIACQAPVSRSDEPFRELKEELGIIPSYEKCHNGCFVRGCLAALGARVSCEKRVYEFGQPLDTLEEAIRFISWQINADVSMNGTVEKRAGHYTHKSGGGYMVPVTRQSCAISFVK
jgi:SAM-dependent methyltransferase